MSFGPITARKDPLGRGGGPPVGNTLSPLWGKGALLAQFPGAYRFVARSGAGLAAEDTADEVDLLGGPLRALVSLQAGDDGAHVGGRTAAGQRQVRLEAAPGVRRHCAGAAG